MRQAFGVPVFQALNRGQYPKIGYQLALPNLRTEQVLMGFGYEVIMSSGQFDADEEVVRLAKERNAFAILAQDSDYLIYDLPESVTYLSLKHFELDTFETKVYCRRALADFLKISRDQLVFLALMKGNDILSDDGLQDFHNRLLRGGGYDQSQTRSHRLTHQIAEHIRNLELPRTKEDILRNIPIIVDKMFGSRTHLDKAEAIIRGYFLEDGPGIDNSTQHEDPKWNEVLVECAFVPGPLFDLLRHQVYESSFKLEDYGSNLPPPVSNLHAPIRQRLYGFLLFEMPGALNSSRTKFVSTVDEWCYAGPGSLNQVTKQSIAMIPDHITHPGLVKLKSLDFSADEKWKIFCYIFSPEIDPDDLAEIGHENLVLALQLYIMQNVGNNGPILFDWEVQAFILTSLVIRTKGTEELSAIPIPPTVPDPRGVQLATVFANNELFWYINSLVGALVKERHIFLGGCFDGKLFQTIYLDLKHGRTELLKHLILEEKSFFDRVYGFATNGGLSLKKK